MAKSCGIHVDQRSVHLVALDGSPKKHRVVAHATHTFPPSADADEVEGELLAFLKDQAKTLKLSKENVALVVDSGPAAFRSLTLPFDDRNKIEEVLKFEIEGDLPQWDIDEVVTDFLVTSSKPGVSSDLIVTAMPKDRLAARLALCERAGLEADEAELDGTALYNAALEAGVFGDESSQILVHVGDHTTVVVVVDGGKLVSMRTIRAGGMPVAKPFQPHGDEEDSSGSDGEGGPGGGDEPGGSVASVVGPHTVRRIQREIVRTISGARLEHPLEQVLCCGHHLPGFEDSDAFEAPVRELKVLPADGKALSSEAIPAYGGALRALGGGALRPHLRREELRFTGAFERLELPLAVFSLLAFFLLLVMFVVTEIQLKWRDTGDDARGMRGDMQVWTSVSNRFMMPNSKDGYRGRLENPPESVQTYVRRMENGEINDRSNFQQLRRLNQLLLSEIDQLERDLGRKSEIAQPQSALHASLLVVEVLGSLGEQAPRFAVRRLEANYIPGRSGGGDSIAVKLDVDFHAKDALTATRHYTNFANAVQEEPWCMEFERKSTKELDSGEGIYIEGLTIRVDLSKLPEMGEA